MDFYGFWCYELQYFFLKKLPPYIYPGGFNLTTHNTTSEDDTTRSRRQGIQEFDTNL
jgi:hypothetical protein